MGQENGPIIFKFDWHISLSIDFLQLKNAVAQSNADEKMELLRLPEHETFAGRFKWFLKEVKNDELSLYVITDEVEAARKARYDASRNWYLTTTR